MTTSTKGGMGMCRIFISAAVLALLAGPAAAQELPALRIALADDADALDPTLARTFVGRIVFAGLCDKLFDIDEKLQIVPQLATSYEWTDSTTLVIKLRAGVLFHDGAKLDAAAVKYSLERHLTLQGSGRRAEIAAMERVEVVDPLTVRVVLKSPSAPFVSQLTDRAGMILSPAAAEAAGKDFALRPVCAGPFKFTERVAQDRIVLDRFAEYWNAKDIHFSRVVYRTIVDNSVKLANLQAGAVDLAERIQPPDVEQAKKDPKLALAIYASLGYNSVNFNLANGPRGATPLGQDARVRKAFELAIDRTALMQVVYSGMYTPLAQAVPQASPFYVPGIEPQPRDIAAARALLQQAGVKLPMVVNLTVTTTPDIKQLGEVIQSMVADAGFEVKLQAMEFASSLDAADRGDFEAYIIGWSGRADADGNMYNFLHSGAPLNYPHYSNRDVDGWLDQARTVTDLAARRDLYTKIMTQAAKDLPILYLDTPRVIVGMTTRLSGFRAVPDGIIRLQGMMLAK